MLFIPAKIFVSPFSCGIDATILGSYGSSRATCTVASAENVVTLNREPPAARLKRSTISFTNGKLCSANRSPPIEYDESTKNTTSMSHPHFVIVGNCVGRSVGDRVGSLVGDVDGIDDDGLNVGSWVGDGVLIQQVQGHTARTSLSTSQGTIMVASLPLPPTIWLLRRYGSDSA